MIWLPLLVALHVASQPSCDVTIAADGNTAAIQAALDRSDAPVICLKPGKYTGARLVARQSATVRRLGAGEVVLDASGQGRVLTVLAPHVHVVLDGLTLQDGRADDGGGLAVQADARLDLRGCVVRDNHATHNGGGLWADQGTVVATRTRWLQNTAMQGAAVHAGGQAHVRLVSNLMTQHPTTVTDTATIALAGQAQLDLLSSTLAYNAGHALALTPDLNARPHARVHDSIVLGAPDSFQVGQHQADGVDVQRSVVSGRVGFVALDLASRRDAPQLDAVGQERARPTSGSPAVGLGRCKSADQRLDLLGQKRGKKCTAGALELERGKPAVERKAPVEKAHAKKAHVKKGLAKKHAAKKPTRPHRKGRKK